MLSALCFVKDKAKLDWDGRCYLIGILGQSVSLQCNLLAFWLEKDVKTKPIFQGVFSVMSSVRTT